MSEYMTPLKGGLGNNQPTPKIHLTTRQGDWVCYNCRNLNFSFRKKCNRCKIQSKAQNQRLESYYQSLPQQYYYYQHKENFPPLCPQAPQDAPSPSHPQTKVPNSSGSTANDQLSPKKNGSELPSVSPLVKRYNLSAESSQESRRGGLFQNESMWANINLKYLQQPKQNPLEEEDLEEMERIIQRIMF